MSKMSANEKKFMEALGTASGVFTAGFVFGFLIFGIGGKIGVAALGGLTLIALILSVIMGLGLTGNLDNNPGTDELDDFLEDLEGGNGEDTG